MGATQDMTSAVTGTSAPMSDGMIASDLMAIAKMDAALWTTTCLESTSPELRAFFQDSLNRCLNAHGQLSKIAEAKGWYHAGLEPTEQLKEDLKFVNSLHGNV